MDLWTDRGDPRGVFTHFQLKRAAHNAAEPLWPRPQSRAEESLLDAHGEAWFGGWLRAFGGTTCERGFPVAADFHGRLGQLDDLVGDPVLRTLRHLRLFPTPTSDAPLEAFLSDPSCRNVRRVTSNLRPHVAAPLADAAPHVDAWGWRGWHRDWTFPPQPPFRQVRLDLKEDGWYLLLLPELDVPTLSIRPRWAEIDFVDILDGLHESTGTVHLHPPGHGITLHRQGAQWSPEFTGRWPLEDLVAALSSGRLVLDGATAHPTAAYVLDPQDPDQWDLLAQLPPAMVFVTERLDERIGDLPEWSTFAVAREDVPAMLSLPHCSTLGVFRPDLVWARFGREGGEWREVELTDALDDPLECLRDVTVPLHRAVIRPRRRPTARLQEALARACRQRGLRPVDVNGSPWVRT